MSSHNTSKQAIVYALSANLGIAIAKGTAAFLTMSGSMLAETIHSIADCTNQLLLMIGLMRANRKPTKDHPMGFGKVVYFWSFIVAILLFSMGGLFSIYEGVHKLHLDDKIENIKLAVIVLVISIILEASSLTGALKEVKKIRKNTPLLKWLKNTGNSELLVVIGEDVAAVLGLCLALLFISLSYFLHNPVFDAIGSISIGSILVIISVLLIIRMKALLIGKAADRKTEMYIKRIIEANKNVKQVLNIITIQMGPYCMLACKLKMKDTITIHDACTIINLLEKEIKKEFPMVKWSFIEPDLTN